MDQNERTRELLLQHAEQYPALQLQDLFKYIFQSACGCEHAVSSPDAAAAYIGKENENVRQDAKQLIDLLDGSYSRVHLACLQRGLSASTLGKLFFLSAKKETDSTTVIEQKLKIARALVLEKALPFDIVAFDQAARSWRSQGYPAIHHSDAFRQSYHPAYRVISNEYLPYLPLLTEIDKAIAKGRTTIAIEGGSASGKTTLAKLLQKIYSCTVYCMDDFFLRPEQRTAHRLAEPGGNVDRERFAAEVLIPHSNGDAVRYRRFDCSTMTILPPVEVLPANLTVIEGAYSMHPMLSPYYDLSVFLDVSPELQRQRILARNSPHMAQRFFNEWIPLERKYFEQLQIKERCSLTVRIGH